MRAGIASVKIKSDFHDIKKKHLQRRKERVEGRICLKKSCKESKLVYNYKKKNILVLSLISPSPLNVKYSKRLLYD